MEILKILNRGIQKHQAGLLEDAQSCYKKVLSLDPENTEANHFLGVITYQLGDLQTGINLISKSLSVNPRDFTALNNLGNAQAQGGRVGDAEKSFRNALKIKPDYATAHANLGKLFISTESFEAAIEHLNKAVHLEPNKPEYHQKLGQAFMLAGLLVEAKKSFYRTIVLSPNDYGTHNELGIVYHAMGRFDEAESCFYNALKINEMCIEAHINLGNLLEDCLRFDEAKSKFHHALEIDSKNIDAHRNLGMLLLREKKFKSGFAHYAWRESAKAREQELQFKGKSWDGERHKKNRLLIHAEQGFGDTIQFARYIPLLEKKGFDVIFECQRSLLNLMKSLSGKIQFIAKGSTLPAFDMHAPLLNVPGLINETVDTIPKKEGYLTVPDNLVLEWEKRMSTNNEIKKVGLVWRGRKDHNNDKNRSASLKLFAEYFSPLNLNFFCLQKELNQDECKLPKNFINIANDFMDFSDTAAVIKNLDLVISVDTSVAHLAGALGIPVWVCLPNPSDWRWFMDRRTTPWYSSMRLFRMEKLEKWDGVLCDLVQELSAN